jgi:hypothetical protein
VKITNERVRELAEMDKISKVIKVRRWKRIGHVLEITSRQPCKNSPNMDTEGKKKEGKIKGDMEENCGEGEETSGIQVME